MSLASIIIPLYNAENFIAKTIESILKQTVNDLEVIVVNDGSTDNSLSIVKDLAKGDPRIKVFSQDNSGVSVARNLGISKSNGEYLFFIDSDDLWKNNNIESRIEFLKKEDVNWIFGAIDLIDEEGNLTGKKIKGKDGNTLHDLLKWNGNVITTPSSITVKKSFLNNIRFDPNFSTAADQDFAIQLSTKEAGKYFPVNSVFYRVVSDSMSRNISNMEKDHIAVFKKAAKLNLFHSSIFEKKCFSNLYWIIGGSWWKNGNNKIRGIYFIFLALILNPLSILKKFK